jgi:hypothetical protein
MTTLITMSDAANTFGTPEWFGTWWPVYSPIILLVLGGIITGTYAIVNRRGGERARNKNAPPPTWPEMWKRIDEQDTRIDELNEIITDMKSEHGREIQNMKDAHEQERRAWRDERMEIIHHVKVLEDLVPTPPGVPPRPWEGLAARVTIT